jgi:recombinational DNA repair protein (RecF pathway)
LPELDACLGCGSPLDSQRAYFSRPHAGLYCQDCRRGLDLRNTWELDQDSRALAQEILRTPIAQLTARPWTQSTAASLRRFLAQQLESHIERKLITFPVLEAAA